MRRGLGLIEGGDDDAVAGGVVAQVGQGAQPDTGRLGGGRLRPVGQQAGGQAGGVADGGLVGAEQRGEYVAGEVELAVAPSGARRPLAGASLPEVAALLVAGAERDLQRGGQGGQGGGVHAGQRGMVQQVTAAAAGTGWSWSGFRGGPGNGQDGVVPLAVELVAC